MSFTVEPLRRVIKKAGGKRISDDAAKVLADILEEKVIVLLKESEKIAKHSGRSTILRRDVKLARKGLEK
ncbi:MAG: NFYB/HAP3 family transcription factor subunit [Candidatus Aenigmarchaeota archaeon]|nr:NFYB/HAP3 family transcription factor subunit [Candidatus Aenigmarchaeota archaeon]